MKQWVEGEGKECRPCRVAVGVGQYRKALTEGGKPELVGVMSKALNEDDDTIKHLAEAMDEVKKQASPELRAKLESIDCQIQKKEECGICEVPEVVAPTEGSVT
jgi:hypothetical protein